MNQRADAYVPRTRDLLLLAAVRPDRLVAVLWWRLIGKRLRSRYRLRDAIAALPFAYERRIESEGQADLHRITAHGTDDPKPADFCIHIHLDNGDAAARGAITSALRQSHRAVDLIITTQGQTRSPGDGAAGYIASTHCKNAMDGFRIALDRAKERGADYLLPLRPDASLKRHALANFAAASMSAIEGEKTPPLLYSDHEEAEGSPGAADPWLKPQWDPRMILSQDYISAACAIPVSSALRCFEEMAKPRPSSMFELLLRLVHADSDLPIRHFPRITARVAKGEWKRQGGATLEAVERVIPDPAQAQAGPFGTVLVKWPLPNPAPLVSVVVATRDKVELLRTCIEGLLHDTDYPSLEIIIADNDSREPETLAYMEQASADPRVTVVRWPHPFNYSAINNFGAGFATGEYLCLLNNDIEILDAGWLTAMVREAAQPGTGAVGARLLYPDRSIQHAGVVIGMGNAAGHAHRGLAEGEPGYFAQALIARGASAVTAACLLVAKRHFDAVGGLDEDDLAVAYNDIDLCLKLGELGLTNIYTPAATLVHHESKSRGLDFSPEHLDRYMRELATFQRRWNTVEVTDPWHHPGMDRASEIYKAQNIA